MSLRRNAVAASLALAGLLATGQMVQASERPVSSGGWAVVRPDGTLGKHVNVASSTRQSAGVYIVQFNQPVQYCAYTGSIRGDDSLLPGYIVVSTHGKKAVEIDTYTTLTLLHQDYKFNIVVTC